MTMRATAPGKAILLGEHFVMYGTDAILCAIQMRAGVSVSKRVSGVRVASTYGADEFADTDPIESAPPHHRPILYIAQEQKVSVDARIESAIPPGVGLGSSSACCVAAAGAILGDSGAGAVDAALRAERSVFAGASGADTAVCAVGGIIRFSRGTRKTLEAGCGIMLAVARTGREHSTAETAATVKRRREHDARLFESLCEQVGGLVHDAQSALRAGDLVSLGAHMSQNHKCLRSVGVSDLTMDRIVGAAAKTSYGAKLTGAGGGGCAIALVDKTNVSKTLDAMNEVGGDAFAITVDYDGLVVG